MSELVFRVTMNKSFGYVATAMGTDIRVEGAAWGDLCHTAVEAAKANFAPAMQPEFVRLRLDHEEIFDYGEENPKWVVVDSLDEGHPSSGS